MSNALRNSLYKELDKRFTKENLELLAFKLGIEEELASSSKNTLLQGFITYLEKRDMQSLSQLIEFCQEINESIDISEIKALLAELTHTNQPYIIPPLLRYLVNRRDQELALARAIKNHPNQQIPLVCLIHGNQDECSDIFVERLEKESLPKILPEQSKNGIKSYYLDCDIIRHINELPDKILASLGKELLDTLDTTLQQVAQVIAQHRCPVILYTHLCTEEWRESGGMQLIHKFLQFWANWQSFPTQEYLVLVCLSFRYREEKLSLFKRLFKKIPTNQQIREDFNKLKQIDFLENFKVSGVVLPELNSIEQKHVETWITQMLDKKYLCGDKVVLNYQIRQLFQKFGYKIPMETLIFELGEILQKYCTVDN